MESIIKGTIGTILTAWFLISFVTGNTYLVMKITNKYGQDVEYHPGHSCTINLKTNPVVDAHERLDWCLNKHQSYLELHSKD